ncbi:hypothetical protein FHT80_005361 [Rhizobium sp. BK226]|nr:hypothetical protein [Rhizobium sp. BK112]MBB3371029.1 hypothetical protein [Rhizobium sp. BK077]MBB3746469.1 hypothetical protein [Rhizobium sp. BK591]MBB4115989.1 hypothetical protein [Rhizobium sp. BK226]MBB4181797.1 hypothetical protein [Rhizobium sp. BK109]
MPHQKAGQVSNCSFATNTDSGHGGYIPAQCMGFHELRL